MTTVQYVAAAAFALVAFTAMANAIVYLYARGVVRAAVDEGSRAAARVGGAPVDCERRARDVLDDLLGPAVRPSVTVRCHLGPDAVTARAVAALRSWLPGIVPDWSFEVEARAIAERAP
jgi:hypothetical protein